MMRQKFHQLLQSCRGLPQKFPQLAATWQKFRPELERFLIAGPTLIGYVLGLLRYPPGSVGFEIGFQSLIFFVGFIVLRITVELAAAFFGDPQGMVVAVLRSVLAAAYLALTSWQYLMLRRGQLPLLAITHWLRGRLQQMTGNAF